MFKVIIAGGRNFKDYELLCSKCDKLLANQVDIEIVSGAARGADKLGEQYADERGYRVKQFPANWDKFKRAAGFIRNQEMAAYADALIAFWDGTSKGTKHIIDIATNLKLKIRIVLYDK